MAVCSDAERLMTDEEPLVDSSVSCRPNMASKFIMLLLLMAGGVAVLSQAMNAGFFTTPTQPKGSNLAGFQLKDIEVSGGTGNLVIGKKATVGDGNQVNIGDHHNLNGMMHIGDGQMKECEGSDNGGEGAGAVGTVCCTSMGRVRCTHDHSGGNQNGQSPLETRLQELHDRHVKGHIDDELYKKSIAKILSMPSRDLLQVADLNGLSGLWKQRRLPVALQLSEDITVDGGCGNIVLGDHARFGNDNKIYIDCVKDLFEDHGNSLCHAIKVQSYQNVYSATEDWLGQPKFRQYAAQTLKDFRCDTPNGPMEPVAFAYQMVQAKQKVSYFICNHLCGILPHSSTTSRACDESRQYVYHSEKDPQGSADWYSIGLNQSKCGKSTLAGGLKPSPEYCWKNAIDADGSPEFKALSFMGLAETRLYEKKYEEGQEYLIKSVKVDGKNCKGWNNLAATLPLTHKSNIDVNDEIFNHTELLQKALTLCPDDHIAWQNLAFHGGGTVKGVWYSPFAAYSKAITLSPFFYPAWHAFCMHYHHNHTQACCHAFQVIAYANRGEAIWCASHGLPVVIGKPLVIWGDKEPDVLPNTGVGARDDLTMKGKATRVGKNSYRIEVKVVDPCR